MSRKHLIIVVAVLIMAFLIISFKSPRIVGLKHSPRAMFPLFTLRVGKKPHHSSTPLVGGKVMLQKFQNN